MNELDLEIKKALSTKGYLQAVNLVKAKCKCTVPEAKEIVDKFISEHPEVSIFKISPKQKRNINIALVIICIIILGGCYTCMNSNDNKASDPAKHTNNEPILTRKERIEKLFSGWDGSQRNVEAWIKANIKDPDSYKHLETRYRDDDSVIFVITQFTGTNSFNARIKTTCIATVDTLGNLIDAKLVE